MGVPCNYVVDFSSHRYNTHRIRHMDNLASKGKEFLLHAVDKLTLKARAVDFDVLEFNWIYHGQLQTDKQAMQ